jgi:surface antigen
MSVARVLVVSFLMVAGSVLSNTAQAKVSFGWGQSLTQEQEESHFSALTHALFYAENGEKVKWHKQGAYGYTVPVYTAPNGRGYCRRLHTYVSAFNKELQNSMTACYDNSTDSWEWITTR